MKVPLARLALDVLSMVGGSVTPVRRRARWLLCAALVSGAAVHACILNPQQLPPGVQPDGGGGGTGSGSGSLGTMGPTTDSGAATGSSSGGSPPGSSGGSGSGGSSGSTMPEGDASIDAGPLPDGMAGDAPDASDANGNGPGDASLDGADDASDAPDGAEAGSSIDPDP